MLLIAVVSAAVFAFFCGVVLVPLARDLARPPSARPDGPESFGIGHAWLAIRTADADRVMHVLALEQVASANWNTGLAIVEDAAHTADWVFVSPPVEGWTFVVGMALPHPASAAYEDRCRALLLGLGKTFRHAQYFAACDMTGLVAWARLEDGKLRRAFAWSDEGVLWNAGPLDPVEAQLGLRGGIDRAGKATRPSTARMLTADHAMSGPAPKPDAVDERDGDRAAASVGMTDGGINDGMRYAAGDSLPSETTVRREEVALEADTGGYPEPQHARVIAEAWSLDPERLSRRPGDPALGYVGVVPAKWRVRRRARPAVGVRRTA
ncbi:MAG: hypothetical protein AAFQ42_15065 [Pseudomonadota bacterium]